MAAPAVDVTVGASMMCGIGGGVDRLPARGL